LAETETPKLAKVRTKAKPRATTKEATEASLDIKNITFKREDF
jgi:hypothetical protein